MTLSFDQHAINHAVVAIDREMTPQGRRPHPDADTIFMGGLPPSSEDQTALAALSLSKNYGLIFASFDPADPHGGPVNLHAFVTDGLTRSTVVADGRLWKRDRRSPAVLLFPGINAVVKISSKGRLVVRGMTGPYADHGYELAREAVLARAARKPGGAPVVANVGPVVAVLDIKALAATFANAE